MLLAIGCDFGELLVGGGVLTRSARVADVTVYDGFGGEGGRGWYMQGDGISDP